MIRDSLPHTLLMPREELNDVNLEDLLIYFSEVKSRVGLTTNTDVWYICQLKISGDEGYSLKRDSVKENIWKNMNLCRKVC
jgi:hypothetical protein